MKSFAGMTEGGTYVPAPEGTFGARLFQAIDLGTQEDKFGSRRKLMVAFELPSKLMEDGRPYTIASWYGATLNRKGNLRNDLTSWLGRELTREEIKPFSWDLFAPIPCLVTITHRTNDDGDIKAKVQGITSVPEDMEVAPRKNELLIFNLEEFSEQAFLKIPDGIAAIIEKSPQYQALVEKLSLATLNNVDTSNVLSSV